MRGVTKVSAVKGQRWYRLMALKDRFFVIAGALAREREKQPEIRHKGPKVSGIRGEKASI